MMVINDGYQDFSAFVPILPKYHWKKLKPFDTNLEPTVFNIANGRVISKLENSALVKKCLHYILTLF